MYPSIFPIVNASSSVRALLSSPSTGLRFWQFGMNKDQPVVYPYAVWRRVFGQPLNYINEVPDTDSLSLQVDVYESPTNKNGGDKVRQIIVALRDAIEQPQVANITNWLPEDIDPDTKAFHMGFTVDWFVAR